MYINPSVQATVQCYYYWYSALGPVWAETRAQSGDWYGSGTLHPGQVLRGSLPLLSPGYNVRTFNCSLATGHGHHTSANAFEVPVPQIYTEKFFLVI